MSAELQLLPLASTFNFAPKTFHFDRPATLELDGHVRGMRSSPAPAPDNPIFPSFALAIDQAFVHYDGTSFTLKSVDYHSDPVCVNGMLLGDRTHTLSNGDELCFGRYTKKDHSFQVDCGVVARVCLPAPRTTNWPGIRQLLDSLRHDQVQKDPSDRQYSRCDRAAALPSRRSPTSVLTSVSESLASPTAPSAVSNSDRILSHSTHSPIVSPSPSPGQVHVSHDTPTDDSVTDVIQEIRRTTTFLCSKIDAMLPVAPTSVAPSPSTQSAAVSSSPTSLHSPPCMRYEDVLATLRARSPPSGHAHPGNRDSQSPIVSHSEPFPGSASPPLSSRSLRAAPPDSDFQAATASGNSREGALDGLQLRSDGNGGSTSFRFGSVQSAKLAMERVRAAMGETFASSPGGTIPSRSPSKLSSLSPCIGHPASSGRTPPASSLDIALARVWEAFDQSRHLRQDPLLPLSDSAPMVCLSRGFLSSWLSMLLYSVAGSTFPRSGATGCRSI
ncbi:hypothetical protein CF326_g9039 [Tilletia indica]|nr:hypothetical protein CF326_g9039 [Tilletia indica]